MGLSRGLSPQLLLVLAAFVPGLVPEINGALSNGLIEPHVIGGVETSIEENPYQVSLEILRTHFCGGAIVSEKHVLTAAHCNVALFGMQVRAGSTIQIPLINFFGGVTRHVQSIKVHPLHNSFTLDYDLAVITVSDNFVYGSRVQPIAVPTEGEVFLDYSQSATVSGWGLTKIGGWLKPLHLRRAQVPLINKEVCKNRIFPYGISDRMLCGAGTGKSDTHKGDSGGPVIHKNKLVGLVSWGLRHINPTFPSVFANLLDREMRSFIRTQTGV